jgi:hypothetical protein
MRDRKPVYVRFIVLLGQGPGFRNGTRWMEGANGYITGGIVVCRRLVGIRVHHGEGLEYNSKKKKRDPELLSTRVRQK